ncbi:STAS domain-containing protein [Catenovulum sp. 2E275]|uniref:STAS domain-containing protein n=1 Tax=Catenovulum sp. 2E275 TaxID=2980497 RepID=UPI0021D1057D|nr:STAS domain-containing protein [Catenovulum sp. 2E275]MCU4674426.1 STAS domain-containing protein [Catenovulum sp. 2E275]
MVNTTNYQLNAIANITQAEHILADFRALSILGQSVALDASLVEKIDTAVMQLIISLQKTLIEKELGLIILSPSQCFLASIEAVGLTQILKIN